MQKISVINGLRGLAILGVIYHHLFWKFTYPGRYRADLYGLPVFPLTFLSNGWAGVNLFFILSGFVLYLPYVRGERGMGSPADLASFYKKRAGRLLPLYYLTTAISMVFFVGVANDPRALRNILLIATATFNFTIDMWAPKYNTALWSIGIEIWFSVLFPLMVLFCRKAGALRVFVYASFLSLAVRYIGVNYPAFEIGSQYNSVLKDSLAGRLDDFALGMLIASIYSGGFRIEGRAARAAAFAAGIFLTFIACNMWDYKVTGMLPPGFIPLITNLFHAGFFLILIPLLSSEGGLLGRACTNYPLQIAGMMCYSLYLWHPLVIYLTVRNGFALQRFALFFALLLGLSALTYRFIEFRKKEAGEIFLLARPRPKKTGLAE